jgi:prepilin-type N-terminal cleavage/methylation domain-containing protein
MPRRDAGFSLIEVIVALALLAGTLVALAHLLVIGTRLNAIARETTLASVLAGQKMEQLRSLAWGFDPSGLPISDTTTDVALMGSSAIGCTPVPSAAPLGLTMSPGDTLSSNVDGYVDFVDARGCPLGGGAEAPAGTMFVRRWAVDPVEDDGGNTLVLRVRVLRWAAGTATGGVRVPGEARLVTVKTRKM